MLRPIALTACLIALTSYSPAIAGKPKSCSGHNRRPANPNGSVLPGTTVAAITASIAPPPKPGPDGRPARDQSSDMVVPSISGPATGALARKGKAKKVSSLTPRQYPSCLEVLG